MAEHPDDLLSADLDAGIDQVDTKAVLECLTPIWTSKPETASRVRGRIERVLNAAKAERLRSGENPAAWRGHLDATLPRPNGLSRGHHAALPYLELPAFMDELRKRAGVAARGLEFVILTATRTSEALNATWDEFDLEAEVWTIPAARMKARVEHRVPLSRRAMEILRDLERDRENEQRLRLRRATRGQSAVEHGAADDAAPHEAGRHHRPMAFARPSATGRARSVRSAANSARRPSRTRSRTKPNAPIVAATRWKSGGK